MRNLLVPENISAEMLFRADSGGLRGTVPETPPTVFPDGVAAGSTVTPSPGKSDFGLTWLSLPAFSRGQTIRPGIADTSIMRDRLDGSTPAEGMRT
jgi:hypothetical protein